MHLAVALYLRIFGLSLRAKIAHGLKLRTLPCGSTFVRMYAYVYTFIYIYIYICAHIHTYMPCHLHCIALHCITLHYATLHCITLHYIHTSRMATATLLVSSTLVVSNDDEKQPLSTRHVHERARKLRVYSGVRSP